MAGEDKGEAGRQAGKEGVPVAAVERLVLKERARLPKHEFILSFVSGDGRRSLSFLRP